jgi:hypothetical protein
MRPVSRKRAVALRVYRKRRDEFLTEHSGCQFPAGCDQQATVMHHRRGRFGARLLDERWWAASCSFHNDFAETHTGESLDIGWLVRIEGVA